MRTVTLDHQAHELARFCAALFIIGCVDMALTAGAVWTFVMATAR